MKPKSEKHKIRDLKRSRQYKILWEKHDDPADNFSFDEINFIAFYPKKESRTNGNRAVRRYEGMIPNGGAYKKIYDVEWEVW